MFRSSVKGTGTPFASFPFTSPPVCHRVRMRSLLYLKFVLLDGKNKYRLPFVRTC